DVVEVRLDTAPVGAERRHGAGVRVGAAEHDLGVGDAGIGVLERCVAATVVARGGGVVGGGGSVVGRGRGRVGVAVVGVGRRGGGLRRRIAAVTRVVVAPAAGGGDEGEREAGCCQTSHGPGGL